LIQPLPPSGSNIQRWGLVHLVKYPSVDHLGNARDASLLQNVRWLILHDWKETLKADNGTFSWGEIYKGWGLCIVEGQASTLTAISNDTRAAIRVLPQKNLTDNLTAGQITTINGWLLNMGMDQTEIDGFNLSGRSVAQIFNWLNRGICDHRFDGVNIIEDHTKIIGFSRSVDEIVNEFNRIKANPLIDPDPDVGLLDDFNRADENPLGNGTWGNFEGGGRYWAIVGQEALVSNDHTDGQSAAMYWSAAQFGGQVQAAVTKRASHVDNGNWQMRLHAKNNNAGSSNGYYLEMKFDTGSTFRLQFYRRTAGGNTALGTAATGLSIPDGTEMWAKYDNDAAGTLTAYTEGVQRCQTTDTTYKDTTGYIAIDAVKHTGGTGDPTWDNFKGGTFIPAGGGWKRPNRPRSFSP